jgi:hypothetical protein
MTDDLGGIAIHSDLSSVDRRKRRDDAGNGRYFRLLQLYMPYFRSRALSTAGLLFECGGGGSTTESRRVENMRSSGEQVI